MGSFELEIEGGSFSQSEIIVFLGKNGTGKTTFIKMLAGKIAPNDSNIYIPKLAVSYKPQEVHFKPQQVICFFLHVNSNSKIFMFFFFLNSLNLQFDKFFTRGYVVLS